LGLFDEEAETGREIVTTNAGGRWLDWCRIGENREVHLELAGAWITILCGITAPIALEWGAETSPERVLRR